MPWESTPEKRRRDAKTYGDPVYRRNRELARRKANGTCAQCQHRHPKLQCDHIVPKSQGGGNALSNLRMLCTGDGSCKCHDAKTLSEGSGWRSKGNREARDPEPRPRTRW